MPSCMSAMQPVVDDNGDLILHGRQGLSLTLEFQNSDGSARDMTGVEVTFEVGPTIDKTLEVTDGPAGLVMLELTNADVVAIANASIKDFAVIDHSGAEPTPVWVGVVYITGWTE